jgi:hypothetical protein
MNEKHIYTVKSKDSKDGHKYSQTIKWDPFTTIDVVKKDGKNSKHFSTTKKASDFISSKKK